jgi:hypothetical protein
MAQPTYLPKEKKYEDKSSMVNVTNVDIPPPSDWQAFERLIRDLFESEWRTDGRGSHRGIAAALREWHRRRAQAAAGASVEMPDHIADAGREFVHTLRPAMETEFAKMRREVSLETELAEHHAGGENAHLHQIINDQERLISEVQHLRAALENNA